MHTRATVEIEAPIETVFRLTTEHVAEWSNVVTEETPLDESMDRVGARFRTVTKSEVNGQQMEFDGVVTIYEPPHASVVELTGRQFDIEAGYTFEDLGGRSRVTQISTVTGKGFFRLIFAVISRIAAIRKASCDAAETELQSLKAYCERANT